MVDQLADIMARKRRRLQEIKQSLDAAVDTETRAEEEKTKAFKKLEEAEAKWDTASSEVFMQKTLYYTYRRHLSFWQRVQRAFHHQSLPPIQYGYENYDEPISRTLYYLEQSCNGCREPYCPELYVFTCYDWKQLKFEIHDESGRNVARLPPCCKTCLRKVEQHWDINRQLIDRIRRGELVKEGPARTAFLHRIGTPVQKLILTYVSDAFRNI